MANDTFGIILAFQVSVLERLEKVNLKLILAQIEFLIAPKMAGQITPVFSDPDYIVLVVCKRVTEPI